MQSGWMLFLVYLAGYALCSGANVGFFAFSKRQLRRRIAQGEKQSASDTERRQAKRARIIDSHLIDPNWTLAAILLANVAFGVQLSQLCDSLFVGFLAVLMPILAITLVGEFFSQATFLRFTGPLCERTSPLIWIIKWITAPVSWPLARLVDAVLGRAALGRLKEQDLLTDLELELRDITNPDEGTHAEHLDAGELRILMNVAKADDEFARDIGRPIDSRSILALPFTGVGFQFPRDIEAFAREALSAAYHRWFVLTEQYSGDPIGLLDADGLARDMAAELPGLNANDHVYKVRIYTDPDIHLGSILPALEVHEDYRGDAAVDLDVVLLWTDRGNWIISGGDILARFLKGIPKPPHRRDWHQRRTQIRHP